MKDLYRVLYLLLVAIGLSACSDDSDDAPAPTPEEPKPGAVIKNGSLQGTVIGTEWSVDYDNNGITTKIVNVKENV